MKSAASVAIVLVALLAAQASVALYMPTPTLSVREQNRQILVAAEGPSYSPLAPATVVRGEMDALTTETLTQAEAIERHLDFLDQFGIRLAAGPPSTQSALPPHQRPPPSGPMLGTFEFRENGLKSQGGTCPVVTPGLPPEVRNAMRDQIPPDGSDRVGLLETNLSESHTSSTTGIGLNSSLTYWGLGNDTAGPPTQYWEYGAGRGEGWSFRAGFIINDLQVTQSTFFCRDGGERVSHHTMVRPYAERTDEPEASP